MLVADNLSCWFQLLLYFFIVCITVLWWIGSSKNGTECAGVLRAPFGSALGMALMTSTTNLLVIAIALEMASLPSYALVGFNKRDRIGGGVVEVHDLRHDQLRVYSVRPEFAVRSVGQYGTV